ncbi:hypothetical protein MMC13_002863 [Lambiella insularis]|nr:hypothetical protein [Lambiella insularis]
MDRPTQDCIDTHIIYLHNKYCSTSLIRDEERLVILNLLNRLYRQIRYGCQNPLCTTPTCLSCAKRQTKGPFRRFTILSARALATFLATGENAERKLCPHTPVEDLEPDDCVFPRGDLARSSFGSQIREAHERILYDRLMGPEKGSNPGPTEVSVRQMFRDESVAHSKIVAGLTPELPSDFEKDAARHRSTPQRKSTGRGAKKKLVKEKDSKSFLQSLFDTEFFEASESVRAEYKGYSLLTNGNSTGTTKGSGTRLTVERNPRFHSLVNAESFTHPLLSVAWKDLEAVFLVDRNNMGRKSDIDHSQDLEAAEIVQNALFALNTYLPYTSLVARPLVWNLFVSLRKYGLFVPSEKEVQPFVERVTELMDSYDSEMALRLVTRIAHAFASRRCWSEASVYRIAESGDEIDKGPQFQDFVRYLMEGIARGVKWRFNPEILNIRIPYSNAAETACGSSLKDCVPYAAIVLEWLRSIILHEWDSQAEVQRFSAVGGAIDFMSCLYEWRHDLGLSADTFCMPFLANRLDPIDLPVEWLSHKSSRNTFHLLSFPFLFTPATLVTYFRAVNYASMAKAYEIAWANFNLYQRMHHIARGDDRIQQRLKAATNNYLVLEIRRDNILSDALDQVWRRQRRELIRPLKVRMGMDEGEEGVDHGGVQQEFFRLALGEVLNPDYGLFTTDSWTQMSWFRPCSLERSYKFELLGLLTSLAIYNGLTLPVTFPLAFYRKLLGMPVTDLAHIRDGWPELTKGLTELLSWSDGDVADVFMRSYVFSFEMVSGDIHINMEREGAASKTVEEEESKAKHGKELCDTDEAPYISNASPRSFIGSAHRSQDGSDGSVSLHNSDAPIPDSGPSHRNHQGEHTADVLPHHLVDPRTDDASMVTNANRTQYVADYIYWLTDKSIRSEYEAFVRGFYLCLDRKALSLFTPEALQNVVEGTQTIDVAALEKHTKYENGYGPQHPTIQDFWFVLRSFSHAELRRLLEFVTASDRVPVKGMASMSFTIQRNGTSDERLPTSLTCFGRLLLPQYSSREKLRERLSLAIENSQGFGVA